MLSPIVVQNADLLRAVAAWSGDQAPRLMDLSRALERDKSNTSRTLAGLIDAGVLAVEGEPKTYGLTEAGRAAVAALAVAEGKPAGDGPADYLALRHAQISPDPLNPRTDWDSPAAVEALDELAADIAANGLLQNLVVKRIEGETQLPKANGVRHGLCSEDGWAPTYAVVGGERRWRAIGRLIERGDWPADRPIACKLVEVDELGHRLKALAENLKRRNLNYIEEAQAYAGLVEAGVKTADLAGAVNVTQRMIQQRLQLLELDEKDRTKVAAGTMTLEDARRKLANRPTPLDLTPAHRLQFCEILHAAAYDPTKSNYSQDVDVRLFAEADATLRQLNALGLINGPYPKGDTAAPYVYVGWKGPEQIKLLFPDFAQDRDAALAAARREALGAEAPAFDGTYDTGWLNGPFEPDASFLAELEEQKRRQAEVTAFHETARKRAADALSNARALVLDLKQPQRPALDDRLASVAAESGAPLPWRQDANGRIVDANGQRVEVDTWSPGPVVQARIALIVAAMNNAAGLETPDAPAEPAEDDSDDADTFEDGDFDDQADDDLQEAAQ